MRRCSVREQDTNIVVLYQGGYGAYNRLQWKGHIRGFVGDFYGHLGCTVCRLPARASCPNSSTIVKRVTGIVERGAKGESDGG